MKAKVMQDVCIGCGACQVIAENVFEIADDGFAVVKKEIDTIAEDEKDNVRDAADGCPTGAIEISE